MSAEKLVEVIRSARYGADVRETNFGVAGVTCASCVGRVERALKKVPGMLDAQGFVREERERRRLI